MAPAQPPTLVPSPAELSALTALIRHQPTPPPLTPILSEFLDLLRPEHHHSFLFTPDPIHVTHFTSPTLSAIAVTNTLTTTRVQAPVHTPSITPLSGESHYEHAGFALVPIFTMADITMGIGVSEGLLAIGSPCLPAPFADAHMEHCNFRFLRDARRRAILLVFDAPEDDAVMVFYAVNRTMTECHSFQAAFRRAHFLRLVASAGDGCGLMHLLPACDFIINEVQHRACPACGVPIGATCACPFPDIRAAHPMDGTHFLRSFQEDFGLYEGVASKLIREGAGERFVQLGVRVSCQGFLDVEHEMLSRLTRWSVHGYLQGKADDPRLGLLCGREEEDVFGGPPLVEEIAIEKETGLEQDQGDAMTWLQDTVGMLFPTESAQGVPSGSLTTADLSGLDDLLGTGSGVDPLSFVGGNELGFGGRQAEVDFEFVHEALPWLEEEEEEASTGREGEQVHSDQSVNRVRGQDHARGGEDSPPRQELLGSSSASTVDVPRRVDNSLHGFATAAPMHANSPWIPAPVPPATVLLPGPVVVPVFSGLSRVESTEEKAKKQTAEERKRRNRVAAQRSNMKRKLACDAIRVQLKPLREKVDELRKREGALREENLAMKKQVDNS